MKPTRPIDILNRGPNWKPTSAAKTDVAATIRAYQRRIEDERKAKVPQRVRAIR